MLKSSFLILNLALATMVWGQPKGFRAVAGMAHAPVFEENGLCTIQSSGNTIIHWSDFSVAENERVQFIQDQATAAVLNRVTGRAESSILGQIHSNGQVILINPQGVVVGPNGRIETAGFMASSLDVLNSDFLEKRALFFSGISEAPVINLGVIQCPAGNVTLLARQVHNEGTIIASQGSASLGAGFEILLQPDGNERVFIQSKGGESCIHNSGTIEAVAVELKASSNPYSEAIQTTGTIQAMSVGEKGGEIFLFAGDGTCEVNGSLLAPHLEGKGGIIYVLGKQVHLLSNAHLDASGMTGGGTILVGGSYQGSNEAIPNATHTTVAKGALLQSAAWNGGNGGNVVVWSDGRTVFDGLVDVKGGPAGGDGGFVEVSGKRGLIYNGLVDADGPMGNKGTLFLDPNDIVIGSEATTGRFTACPGSIYTIVLGTETNQISNESLAAQLANCNVTISTVDSSGSGPNSGSITVAAGVTWTAATTLTLTADSFIAVNALLNASGGAGGVALIANGNKAGANPAISINKGGSVRTASGSVVITGTSSTAETGSHGVYLNGGNVSSSSGTIEVTGTVPAGPTTTANGVQMRTIDGITSTTGAIHLHGSSAASGSNSHGLSIANSWAASTSETVTFSNCKGGTGATSHGLHVAGYFSTWGPIVATDTIQGGTGSGSVGYNGANGLSSIGGGDIAITASTQGRGTESTGIKLTLDAINTTGDITLNGTASSTSTGFSRGVHLAGGRVRGGRGTIRITGTVPMGATGSSHGFLMGTRDGVTGGGPMIFSGTSAAGDTSQGVLVYYSWVTGTNETVSFSNCQGVNLTGSLTTSGAVQFTGCSNLKIGNVINATSCTVEGIGPVVLSLPGL